MEFFKKLYWAVIALIMVTTAMQAQVTSHPRIWVTQNDLPRLRQWANSNNPMWTKGLNVAATQAKYIYDTKFFPGGMPAVPFPDNGTSNYELYCSEAYAQFFAFMSLVDPVQTNRDDYAARARRLLMYVMDEAVKGQAPSQNGQEVPFRSYIFAIYNRANYWSSAFGTTVDWIYPYLSDQDKQTIRTVFMRWSNELLGAYAAGNEHPQPVGMTNNPILLGTNNATQKQFRWSANNYYIGHFRHLSLMALSMDQSDDPPLDPNQPDLNLGNSLRSYIPNALGSWLYQIYGMFEDSSIVAKDYNYNASNISIGKAAGGLPVEGTLYGESLGYMMQALLAFHTAGYNDTALAGPQIKMLSSSYWDKSVDGFLHTMTPTPKMSTVPGYSYLGAVYEPAAYGDVLRFWVTFQYIQQFGPMGVYDYLTNNTQRLDKERWISKYALEDGANSFYNRSANVWSDVDELDAIFYFLLFDPNAQDPQDPRQQMSTDFYMPAIGRVLSRTDWTASSSWVTYLCSWMSINHQNGAQNQFEFYRNGEWLTKEWSGYANDQMGMTSQYNNTLAIKNDKPTNLHWFEVATDSIGGQWTNGQSSGDPTNIASFNPNYTFVQGITTNLYNSRNAQDVQHASRSFLWIKPDHIIVYDRATTGKAGKFKRFHISLVDYPVISGNNTTVTSQSGQQLYIKTLLPSNASIQEQHNWITSPDQEYDKTGWNEPCKYRLMIEDTTNPKDVRFLNVLQGADAGLQASATQYLQSSAGTPYEGALVGNVAVMFMKTLGTPFLSLTYSVPSTTSGHLITGLNPNASYAVNLQNMGNQINVTVTPNGSMQADSAGVLMIGNVNIVVPGLKAPALKTPSNSAVSVPISINLSWFAVNGATTYHLQVSKTSNFSAMIFEDSTLVSTSSALNNLSYLTKYYWRVASKNSSYKSGWSAAWSFTTAGIPSLNKPVLASPANNSINIVLNPTLSWNAVSGATSYRLQLAKDYSFSNIIVEDSTITSSNYSLSALQNTTQYFWRVMASNSNANSSWSDAWTFTTNSSSSLSKPILNLPVNNATNVPVNQTFSWSMVNNATHYRLQIAVDYSFNNKIYDDSTLTQTSKSLGWLSTNTKYFWRVLASNSGGASAWSEIRAFTTGNASNLSQPLLNVPANNATNVPVDQTFSWSMVNNATHYRLQIAVDYSFNNKIYDDSTLTQTSKSLGWLSTNTKYFWRVLASNSGGAGAWSEIRAFTTDKPNLLQPTLNLPANNATNVPVDQAFSWSMVNNATHYRLQIAVDYSFNNKVYDDSTLIQTSKSLGWLNTSTKYFWRVLASNSGGVSAWSEICAFTTGMGQKDSVPQLNSPPDNATNVPLTRRFRWYKYGTASGYRIQISTNYTFSSTFYDNQNVTDTVVQVPNLSPSTGYYWRVLAYSNGVPTGWSDVRYFTTVSAQSIPPVVLQLQPQNNAVEVNLNAKLVWFKNQLTDSYKMQVSKNQSFTQLIVNKLGITDTTLDINLNDYATIYYWRVAGVNQYGTGPWSETWQFTTQNGLIISENKEISTNSSENDMQIYPNPVNGQSVLRFRITNPGIIKIGIYDINGNEVIDLLSSFVTEGSHFINLGQGGQIFDRLSGGTYFCRMTCESDGSRIIKEIKIIK